MPTYTFLDKRTGEEYEEVMMIAEMEKHKRKKHIELLLSTGEINQIKRKMKELKERIDAASDWRILYDTKKEYSELENKLY